MASKFESEIIEPEERAQAATAPSAPREVDFNPLDEPVTQRSYTSGNVNTSGIDLNTPIAEPSFAPPPIDTKRNIPQEDFKKKEPINPEMKGLPKKEVDMAAGQMAKMIMQGYEWMHDLANKGLQVNEKKLNKLQRDGEINLNAMIDYELGKQIRAGDFFLEYNSQVNGLLKVSDEFKEETLPVLERVLASEGLGMTDKQYLIYLFGKDIAAKSIIFFQQKSQLNYMIQSIKEATTSQYVQQAPPPPPTPEPQRAEPQPQRASEPEEYTFTEEIKEEVTPVIISTPVKRRGGRPKKI
jgi:hypothetical protein